MSLLGRCTLTAGRVLFSSSKPRLKWPLCKPPNLPASSFHTSPPRPTAIYTYPIGPKPSLRARDRLARQQVYDTLLYLLRSHSGREYGLDVRPDGYLSVRKLLNYPLFRAMDLLELQELIESDGKYRFQLLFDPLKGEEAWWIRAKLWDERRYTLLPCRLIHGVRLAVYKTTLAEWNSHISRTGIPLLGREYIQIDRTIKTEDYIDNLNPESHVFIFLDIQKCILNGLRFSYLLQISSHISPSTPLVTKGNHMNLIPPELFERAQLVEASKTHLWGAQGVSTQKTWPAEPDDFDERGRRKTLLPLLRRGVHGFVDMLEFGVKEKGSGVGVIDEHTMQEAREVIEEAEGSPFDVQRPRWRPREERVLIRKPGVQMKPLRPRPPPLPSSSPPLQQPEAAPPTPTTEEDSSGLLKPWKPTSTPFFPRPRKQKSLRFLKGSGHMTSERRKTFRQREPSSSASASDASNTEQETVFGEGVSFHSRPAFVSSSPKPSARAKSRRTSTSSPPPSLTSTSEFKGEEITGLTDTDTDNAPGLSPHPRTKTKSKPKTQIMFIGRTGTKWKGKRGKRGKGRRGKGKGKEEDMPKKPSRKNRREPLFWPSYFNYYRGGSEGSAGSGTSGGSGG